MTNLELGRKKWPELDDETIIGNYCPAHADGINYHKEGAIKDVCKECWSGEAIGEGEPNE